MRGVKILRLADRAQRWAEEAINETAYALSYEPGSTRYYQARKRAETAEKKMRQAFDELRALGPEKP